MIKKLQALKSKKGFTLVELIVVIAIIGVLAAILIPIMLGYVTNSRIQSLNTTASSFRTEINAWISEQEGRGVVFLSGGAGGELLPLSGSTPTLASPRNFTISINNGAWTGLNEIQTAIVQGGVTPSPTMDAAVTAKLQDVRIGAFSVFYANGAIVASAFVGTANAPAVTFANGNWTGGFSATQDGRLADNRTIVGTHPQFRAGQGGATT